MNDKLTQLCNDSINSVTKAGYFILLYENFLNQCKEITRFPYCDFASATFDDPFPITDKTKQQEHSKRLSKAKDKDAVSYKSTSVFYVCFEENYLAYDEYVDLKQITQVRNKYVHELDKSIFLDDTSDLDKSTLRLIQIRKAFTQKKYELLEDIDEPVESVLDDFLEMIYTMISAQ